MDPVPPYWREEIPGQSLGDLPGNERGQTPPLGVVKTSFLVFVAGNW
jgi:hypothetical protein